MQLVFHGGLCCGIKTIFSMGTNPDSKDYAIPQIAKDDRDQNGSSVTSDTRFFHEAAPEEKGTARLDRYIDYMKRRRPCNILEVVIAINSKYSWIDQSRWIPELLSRGFKEVNRHLNSNSGNTCVVFHLNVDENYPGKEDAEAIDDEDCDEDE